MLLVIPMAIIIGLLPVLIMQNMADDTKDAPQAAAADDQSGSYRRRIRDTEIRERKAGSEQTSQAPSEMKGSATGQEMTSIVSDIPSQPPPKKTDTPRQDQTDPAKPLKASSPSTHTQNSSSSTPETIQKQVPANQRPTAKASATTAKKSETSSQKVTKRAQSPGGWPKGFERYSSQGTQPR